ncbi:UNVERIFIED_CONTAM: Rab3 GTPase-activating protein catalytic subunit [Sesamum radiatum]|uniref:Rab3 GTPase-activating protein catalytic subunit n=1 Tax=Sesamum radiatum TaxID=300843 RepID=A0AAW2LQ08_SESRA
MEASFVSRARTAINSAAAKAEKVFTDIKKSDSIAHRDLDKQSPSASTPESSEGADESKDYHEAKSKGVRPRPSPIKTKRDWHERFRNIRIGKRGPEDSRKTDNSTMAYAIFDDNLYLKGNKEVSDKNDSEDQVIMESSKAMNTDIIPSSAIVKQLAVAIDVGAGCSQLLSDMQAFKVKSNMRRLLFLVKAFLAANPGCILENFVRWHSPPDWLENDTSSDLENASGGGDVSTKGQLSTRMQKEGNLWRELWETSKPVPAVRQAPLYDEDLAVEGILDGLEEISPPELFKQLFIAVLGSGLVIAEATLSTHSTLSSFYNECKNYITVTCQGNIWTEKLDDICQVYETVETMLLNQDEALLMTAQPEETTGTSDMKNRLKILSLIFSGKNKSSSKAKKPPKAAASPADNGSVENDWTIV